MTPFVDKKGRKWYDWHTVLWYWTRILGRTGLTVQALAAILDRPSGDIIRELEDADAQQCISPGICTGIKAPILSWCHGAKWNPNDFRLLRIFETLYPYPPFKGIEAWAPTMDLFVLNRFTKENLLAIGVELKKYSGDIPGRCAGKGGVACCLCQGHVVALYCCAHAGTRGD